jgi:hypothetical protein
MQCSCIKCKCVRCENLRHKTAPVCRWKWSLNVCSWEQTTLPSGASIRVKERPSHCGHRCITSDDCSRNWYEEWRFLKPEELSQTSFPARHRSSLLLCLCSGRWLRTAMSWVAPTQFAFKLIFGLVKSILVFEILPYVVLHQNREGRNRGNPLDQWYSTFFFFCSHTPRCNFSSTLYPKTFGGV